MCTEYRQVIQLIAMTRKLMQSYKTNVQAPVRDAVGIAHGPNLEDDYPLHTACDVRKTSEARTRYLPPDLDAFADSVLTQFARSEKTPSDLGSSAAFQHGAQVK